MLRIENWLDGRVVCQSIRAHKTEIHVITHCECQVVHLFRSLLKMSDIISPVLVVEKLDFFKVSIPPFLLWLGVDTLLLYTICSHIRNSVSVVKRIP